ncbi:hypothetical protein KAK06_13950 [Ideonella sp. 4Y11]|uniref:Transmembrane protein n=2 Tax=Ideonella aquatica TaxID=2824119 RepID=A0A940YNC0_9BURK|nr:hypothetical protein [Ideonella aquatica]
MARLRQGLLAPLKWLLALLILFEEWGWEPLQRVVAAIGRWPGFRWIEGWVRRLPPYAALALFALPALALLPVKLAALWAIRQGHALLGVTVIVVAKLVGTAIVARLFTLTHDALMRLPWFAALYARWSAWKAGLLAWARATAAWQAAQDLKARVRAWLAAIRNSGAGQRRS